MTFCKTTLSIQCHYTEYRYAGYYYAECRYAGWYAECHYGDWYYNECRGVIYDRKIFIGYAPD